MLVNSLSRGPFVNVVSLVRDIMLKNIKPFCRDDMLFSILFESLSKEFRKQEEIDKYLAYVLDAQILYYN